MAEQTETLEPPRAARSTPRVAPSTRLRRSAQAFAADGYRVLPAVVIAALAGGLLALLPQTVLQDTWLALVDGAQVASQGIPHHVTLTLFAYGRPAVDQQWLAQLLMYLLDRFGGIPLVGAINVALVAIGLAGAVVAALRLGASPRSVIRVLPAGALCVVLTGEVRTQPYAYPLFVAVVYLLARDSRRPSRMVFWSLPLLVLWGNLHGSASLGAGLVALRGLTILWERRRVLAERSAVWGRAGALIVGAPVCLLVTPYGLSMISYYRSTVLNPGFRAYVVEWQPVTSFTAQAVIVFVLAAIAVWSFGRYPRQTTLWERCAMLVLIAGAIIALRNLVWLGYGASIVLPLSIDGAVRARARPSKSHPALNLALMGVVALFLLVVLARNFTSSEASLEPSYPRAALAVVRAAAAEPKVRVFADEHFADWMLWELPSLRGRIAYDASFEQLTARQLAEIYDLKTVTGLDWGRAARGYRLLVLSTTSDPALIGAVRREPGARVLYDRDGMAVIER